MKRLTGYCTRYALTAGIYPVTVETDPDLKYAYTTDRWKTQLVLGKTFFKTLDEAKAQARELATKRVANLEKQIRKLKQLTIEPKVQA